MPVPSFEVRWFIVGTADEHPDLKQWFETTAPWPQQESAGTPAWQEYREDIYLLIPNGTDMGIKWREGKLQIKGRVSDIGAVQFASHHIGRVDRWLKWSYSSELEAYQQLFEDSTYNKLARVTVGKTRALRKIRLDTVTGKADEVDLDSFIDRGMGCELTNVTINDNHYCSLAFEAFPDDSGMIMTFTKAVSDFLNTLETRELTLEQSASYPIFLKQLGATSEFETK